MSSDLAAKAADYAATLEAEGWEPGSAQLRAERAYGLRPTPTERRSSAGCTMPPRKGGQGMPTRAKRVYGERLAADVRDFGPDMPKDSRRALVTLLATSQPGREGERVHREVAGGKGQPRQYVQARRVAKAGAP